MFHVDQEFFTSQPASCLGGYEWPHTYQIDRDPALFHRVLLRMENGVKGDVHMDPATLLQVEEEFAHFNLTVPEVRARLPTRPHNNRPT